MHKTEKILIIDEQKWSRDFLKTFLEKKGYITCSVPNFDKGKKLMENQCFDLVIINIDNIAFNLSEIIYQIKKSNPGIIAYALTSNYDKEIANEAMSKGINGFFSKPFNANTIEWQIFGHLDDKKRLK